MNKVNKLADLCDALTKLVIAAATLLLALDKIMHVIRALIG